jgi:amine acid ABC transporter, permease protein, 3-TM region, His/Glu/Gln/Arg/opine family
MTNVPTTFFGWVAFILKEYYPLFIRGIGVTLLVAITGTLIGFVLGLLVAVLRTIPEPKRKITAVLIKAVKFLCVAYIEIFRGTPMIVQAMVIYYGIVQLLPIPPLAAAIFVISVNTGAYMAEIVRGGIISVDKGQTEAALSVGMTHWQIMTTVVLPQAIRNIMPSIGNEFVVNIKDSSVLNVISVSELYFMSKSAAGTYLRYFEVFFITAVIYFVLTFTVTRLLRLVEKKMDGPQNFAIHGSQSDVAESVAAMPKKK